MDYKIGDISKFPFAMRKTINNVQKVDFEYTSKSIHGNCPNCGFALGADKVLRIVKLISIDNSKHYIGYSDKGHTLKIPKNQIPKENR